MALLDPSTAPIPNSSENSRIAAARSLLQQHHLTQRVQNRRLRRIQPRRRFQVRFRVRQPVRAFFHQAQQVAIQPRRLRIVARDPSQFQPLPGTFQISGLQQLPCFFHQLRGPPPRFRVVLFLLRQFGKSRQRSAALLRQAKPATRPRQLIEHLRLVGSAELRRLLQLAPRLCKLADPSRKCASYAFGRTIAASCSPERASKLPSPVSAFRNCAAAPAQFPPAA